MKIFYSPVARQKVKVKLTINQDGFIIEQANLVLKTDEFGVNLVDADGNTTGELVATEFDDRMRYDVKFADILTREDLSDRAAYCFPSGQLLAPMFNFWQATQPGRLTGRQLSMQNGFSTTACLIVPFKDSEINNWVLGIHVNPDPQFFEIINGTAVEHPVDSVGGLGSLREIMSPSITFDNLEVVGIAETIVEVPFTVLDSSGEQHLGVCDVYLEVTGGNLLMARVRAVNGKGIARISLANMMPSDQFKIKAGFKYYSGVSECKITVQ